MDDLGNRDGSYNSGDTNIAEYAYDTQGRRIRVYDAVSDATTLYYYSDNWQVLAEYNGSGVQQAYYIFGNYIDEVLLMNRGGSDKYYLHDHLYSPAALLDNSGNVIERYEYDAYGKVTVWNAAFTTTYTTSQYGNPYVFTGRELDTLDAGSCTPMHYRHRAYSPEIGRFMQHDPHGINPVGGIFNPFQANIQFFGSNLYQYAENKPISNIDFSGLASYQLGYFDFKPTYDIGAGTHGGAGSPTIQDRLAKIAWYGVVVAAEMRFMDDAAKHMNHFLGNSGSKYTINYPKLINDVINAGIALENEVDMAMMFSENWNGLTEFAIASHSSTTVSVPQDESWNWYYAVNEYHTWGKGKVRTDGCNYTMDFTLIFGDKYNWNIGQAATILGIKIPDAALGRLHQVGIAQEYEMAGQVEYTVNWKRGNIYTTREIINKGR